MTKYKLQIYFDTKKSKTYHLIDDVTEDECSICSEKLQINDETLMSIQDLYKSDIRSMINYIQSNKNFHFNKKAINNSIWEGFTKIIIIKELIVVLPVP